MLSSVRKNEPAGAGPPQRQGTPLGAQAAPGPRPEPGRLTVGPGISLSGEIAACDRLVVQGDVRVTLDRVRALEVAEGGRFTGGRAEVEEAEVAGEYEGGLTVRGRLLVRGTGRVSGTVRYGELELERGGRLSGSVEALERAGVGPGPSSEAPPEAPLPTVRKPPTARRKPGIP
jgi:cytoskeletal protein CcmA (bactofilin family)